MSVLSCYIWWQRDGEGGALLKVYQLKIMPIISYIAPKGYLYPIPRARSNYTLKPVKSVIIIYPS